MTAPAEAPSLRRRLAAAFALPAGRSARVFAIASLIDALGSGMFMPVSVLYFVRSVGLSAPRVGFGLGVAAGVGIAGTLAAGVVVDRFGAKPTVVALNVLRAVGFASYALVRSFPVFLVVVCLVGFVDRMGRPATQALVAGISDGADRVTTLAFVRSVRNLGYALGGLAASLALAVGTRSAYLVVILIDAATYLVAAFLLSSVVEADVELVDATVPSTYRRVLRDRKYVALAACSGVLSLHLSLLLVGIPLWIVERTAAPDALVGLLFTLNCILVVVLQVPVSRRSTTHPEFGRAFWHCGLGLAAATVLLSITDRPGAVVAVALLLTVCVIETAGELAHSVGGWGLSLGLAPADARGRYLSVWTLGFDVQQVIGPFLMTLIVVRADVAVWAALAAVFVVTGAIARALSAEPAAAR
ncbi:MAG TPA: MFS transporter [Mycobacteriales bacterium]|nr:MFS transporter [Mycobacteriales bacterium]